MTTTQNLSLTAIGAGAVGLGTFAASAISPLNEGVETQRATAALPASTTGAIFTIAGGKVKILDLVGEVTTNIQAQACATKLQAHATGQTAVDMCATGDVNGKAAATYLSITGVAATALQMGFAVLGVSQPWIVGPGTIDLNTAATNTGSVKWVCRWVAIDAGATVVAA